MIKIATNIKTELWNNILNSLQKQNWEIKDEYPDIYDKGVDNDCFKLRKGRETIKLGWTNWSEGEIKASEKRLKLIEKEFDIAFEYNSPEFLEINLIDRIFNLLKHR